MWRSGGGAWRRRLRRAPSLSAMTDEEMQRVVLAVVLREYPVLLDFPRFRRHLSPEAGEVQSGVTTYDLIVEGLSRHPGVPASP